MKLKVLLPERVLLEAAVTRVTAEAANGSFCMLPKHVDFAAALVPGILAFEDASGHEGFVAVDEGAVVKCGPEVLVSTRRAVRGSDLATLEQTVNREFRVVGEREQQARSTIAKLEAGFIRQFLDLQDYGQR